MLAAYFGFQRDPFTDRPDAAYIDSSIHLRGVFAQLLAGIMERKGLLLVVGEPGSGKTTLLRRLREELRERCVFFTLAGRPELGVDDVLHEFCAAMGVDDSRMDRIQRARAVVAFLIGRWKSGEVTGLLVDDAERLQPEVLRHFHLLAELGDRRLLQIVLSGGIELEAVLERKELLALQRDVAVRCRLQHLKAEDVGSFIDEQLRAVGWEDPELFPPEVVERIAELAGCSPRRVNLLCTQALLITSLEGGRSVSLAAVRQAAQLVLAGGVEQSEEILRRALADEPLVRFTKPLQRTAAAPTAANDRSKIQAVLTPLVPAEPDKAIAAAPAPPLPAPSPRGGAARWMFAALLVVLGAGSAGIVYHWPRGLDALVADIRNWPRGLDALIADIRNWPRGLDALVADIRQRLEDRTAPQSPSVAIAPPDAAEPLRIAAKTIVRPAAAEPPADAVAAATEREVANPAAARDAATPGALLQFVAATAISDREPPTDDAPSAAPEEIPADVAAAADSPAAEPPAVAAAPPGPADESPVPTPAAAPAGEPDGRSDAEPAVSAHAAQAGSSPEPPSERVMAAGSAAPAATVAAVLPPARTLQPRAAARSDDALMRRGEQLLAAGDFAAARLFFEKAAADGDPRASTAVGRSYDPNYLRQIGVRGSRGDVAKAIEWYSRGIELGDAEAKDLLTRLQRP